MLLATLNFRQGGGTLCDGFGKLGYEFQASSASRKGENSVLVASRLEARVHDLSRRLQPLGLVLGDLNTGLPFQDERGKSFKCVDGFEQLLRANLIDAWRSRHPDGRDFSWFSARGNGFRLDHALATPAFDKRIVGVSYDHASRARGLTDHAALRVRCDGQWHRPADLRR